MRRFALTPCALYAACIDWVRGTNNTTAEHVPQIGDVKDAIESART